MTTSIQVPFFRPQLTEEEIGEVVATLRSGWLTSGPRVRRFEEDFRTAVGAAHAVAVSSCTAALHLATEALELKPGQAVLVPTMTFAATAEVVRYQGAVPILVDCDPITLNMDLEDAALKLARLNDAALSANVAKGLRVVGIIPVHVAGVMMDMEAVQQFASRHGLWVVEDAAHAFPAGWRKGPQERWQPCGSGPSEVACFSFYVNKTITTGEGGMATTSRPELAERMRVMSLHGLSHDAWGRFARGGNWDYKILAPGYKYNLTDIAAALGIHQLARAEQMRREREQIALYFLEALAEVTEIELPVMPPDRIHSWHLFPIRLRLNRLTIRRDAFIEELKARGVGCSVHWRPLHLHPYYQQNYGWQPDDFPVATAHWLRLISLPIFPGMQRCEMDQVVNVVRTLCADYSRKT
jgi:dTDP-4-amino-4,6-dideoxygalactose transaminase